MTASFVDPHLVPAGGAAGLEPRALFASRTRIAATADEHRRRLQHDLHHGAQQRLVHTVIALRLARDALAAGPLAAGHCPADLVDEALAQAERASSALGDVVRATLPTVLVHGGLRLAVESLLADLRLTAQVCVAAPRLPAATETTAYLVVAEALTNVAVHACAERVGVLVELVRGVLVVEVRDDGVGGADPTRGRGLTGLVDRVEAAEGTVAITSPPGAGTVVRAMLPVEVA